MFCPSLAQPHDSSCHGCSLLLKDTSAAADRQRGMKISVTADTPPLGFRAARWPDPVTDTGAHSLLSDTGLNTDATTKTNERFCPKKSPQVETRREPPPQTARRETRVDTPQLHEGKRKLFGRTLESLLLCCNSFRLFTLSNTRR